MAARGDQASQDRPQHGGSQANCLVFDAELDRAEYLNPRFDHKAAIIPPRAGRTQGKPESEFDSRTPLPARANVWQIYLSRRQGPITTKESRKRPGEYFSV
ncbi:hypothetical protein GCM10027167_52970 [Nocardia heshunensis]